MKKSLFVGLMCLCVSQLFAQITIMSGSVQEKVVSKPQAFDSLSTLRWQNDPIQYKQYIGYKLYCLPLSTEFKCKYSDCTFYLQNFRLISPQEVIIPHKPYSQTDGAMMFGDVKKLKGSALAQYKERETEYEKSFKISTDIYHAAYSEKVSDQHKYYTPYEEIQNTYFTILDIEVSETRQKAEYSKLEEFICKYRTSPNTFMLRFLLKNETSGEELYWIIRSSDLEHTHLFLVPYFEKMQKMYKGQKVVPTTEVENLVDVETDAPVIIQPKEVWICYDVTFVNLKEEQLIKPFFFLEKEGKKVKVKFEDFSKECNGIFTEEDRLKRPMFMLESDFNEIVAEKNRAIEEKRKWEEEKQRQEDLARQQREQNIIKKYGTKLGSLICKGEVCLGMNKEMCKAAWGEPISINSTIVEGMVHEQWVYGWKTYLYFDNGILKAIQN